MVSLRDKLAKYGTVEICGTIGDPNEFHIEVTETKNNAGIVGEMLNLINDTIGKEFPKCGSSKIEKNIFKMTLKK